VGALAGVPVGIKDIIDTADMPTENGTPLDAGRRPERDAAVVARLRAAGAVILGKTVTTELGAMHPLGTRNPHHPEHTPGGSSSGSAAAVAAGMVALALGTQTNGSVIRPASFCGVVGYKPSFGLIPRTGVLPQAPPLDTVGVFARSLADAALTAEVLAGPDPGDPDAIAGPTPRLTAAALAGSPSAPAFAFVRSPAWDLAEDSTKEAFAGLAARLGGACTEETLPESFAHGLAAQRTLNLAGIGRHYRSYAERGAAALSPFMRMAIADGRKITAVDYFAALDLRAALRAALAPLFDRYDAILTPAAPGAAPRGLGATGNPAFCSLWSLTGLPAVSLPLLAAPNRLPFGVQLVGRPGDDARLLAAAGWLTEAVGPPPIRGGR
jgi:Asp-tRNA(Asn)/Glu-tRNA(Gln) amidotransferase A subunit family amidase